MNYNSGYKNDIAERWRLVATKTLNMIGRNHIDREKFDSYSRLFQRGLEGLRKYDQKEADDLSKSYDFVVKRRQRDEERKRILGDHGLLEKSKEPENGESPQKSPVKAGGFWSLAASYLI